MTADPFLRISILGTVRNADLVVPADQPATALLPQLLGLLGEGHGQQGTYTLTNPSTCNSRWDSSGLRTAPSSGCHGKHKRLPSRSSQISLTPPQSTRPQADGRKPRAAGCWERARR